MSQICCLIWQAHRSKQDLNRKVLVPRSAWLRQGRALGVGSDHACSCTDKLIKRH